MKSNSEVIRVRLGITMIAMSLFVAMAAGYASPGYAATARTAACTAAGHAAKVTQALRTGGETWITGETCRTESLERSHCVNRFGATTVYSGNVVYGNGSSGSNYSLSYCGGGFVINQVYLYYRWPYNGDTAWHVHVYF